MQIPIATSGRAPFKDRLDILHVLGWKVRDAAVPLRFGGLTRIVGRHGGPAPGIAHNHPASTMRI